MLNGVTFVLFGAILLGPALGELTWRLALYASSALRWCGCSRSRSRCCARTPGADRRVPGLVRPARPGFDRLRGDRDRGVAAPHENLIVLAIYLTVGLSVLAHGLTAAPLPTATPAGTSGTRATRS